MNGCIYFVNINFYRLVLVNFSFVIIVGGFGA